MYAEAALRMLPYSSERAPPPYRRRFPPPDDGMYRSFQAEIAGDAPYMGSLGCRSNVWEYGEFDLGGEGDLFKAPETIIEEPDLSLDPMVAAISIMSAGEDAMTESLNISAMESMGDPLLSDAFYDCQNGLIEKSAIGEPIFDLPDLKIPPLRTDEVQLDDKNKSVAEESIQRSISTGSLSSADWANGCMMRPNFLDFQGLDFEAAFGIRRAFSEGDIQQCLGNNKPKIGNTSSIPSPLERLSAVNSIKAEERREKLSRYRKKKAKRNFGRKIKYACRKALADSQPRVRGRFAKTEDGELSKLH